MPLPGPQGPRGPSGDQGPTGDAGEPSEFKSFGNDVGFIVSNNLAAGEVGKVVNGFTSFTDALSAGCRKIVLYTDVTTTSTLLGVGQLWIESIPTATYTCNVIYLNGNDNVVFNKMNIVIQGDNQHNFGNIDLQGNSRIIFKNCNINYTTQSYKNLVRLINNGKAEFLGCTITCPIRPNFINGPGVFLKYTNCKISLLQVNYTTVISWYTYYQGSLTSCNNTLTFQTLPLPFFFAHVDLNTTQNVNSTCISDNDIIKVESSTSTIRVFDSSIPNAAIRFNIQGLNVNVPSTMNVIVNYNPVLQPNIHLTNIMKSTPGEIPSAVLNEYLVNEYSVSTSYGSNIIDLPDDTGPYLANRRDGTIIVRNNTSVSIPNTLEVDGREINIVFLQSPNANRTLTSSNPMIVGTNPNTTSIAIPTAGKRYFFIYNSASSRWEANHSS